MGRKRLSTGLGEEACLSGWAPGRTAWTHWGMQDASLVDGFFDAWAFRLVLGTRCRVPGTWDPVPNRRRGPEPSTGDRAKCTRRVCKIQDAGWWGWNGPWGGGFRVARSLLEVVGRSAGRGGGCAHRDCWDGGWPYAVGPADVGGREACICRWWHGFCGGGGGGGPTCEGGRTLRKEEPPDDTSEASAIGDIQRKRTALPRLHCTALGNTPRRPQCQS